MDLNSSNDYPPADTPKAMPPRRWWQKVLAIALPFLIIGVGVAGASYLLKSSPKAPRKQPPKIRPLVEVAPVQFSDEQVVVKAMGTVIPARKIELKTSVSGPVAWLHPAFTEGGLLKKGDIALKLDPSDYRLRIIEQEAQVAQARYALKLELGYQEVAEREWHLLGKNQITTPADQDLALRKPHLEKAQADLKAAQATLDQARINLERTVVKIPFNAMVSQRMVDVGSHVTAQTTLATLTGTDRYWIQASVPMDRLNWISVPRNPSQKGSQVTIYQNNLGTTADTWQGEVLRLMGDVDPQGRMVRVLVGVSDPLNLLSERTDRRQLLLGAFVHANVDGKQMRTVARLPRASIHTNDTVWILRKDGTLAIRPVTVVWRGNEDVLVSEGLSAGDNLIVSNLAAPVEGMPLRMVAASDLSDN